jgi:Spy/CpxP family protein refolding chaperone
MAAVALVLIGVVAGVGLVLVGTDTATAQVIGAPPASAGEPPNATLLLPMLLASVALTADQIARVHELVEARRPVSEQLTEQLRQAEEQLADDLTSADELPVADIQAQLDAISALRQQLLEEAASFSLELRSILTPDQLTVVQQAKDRLRARQSRPRH